MREYCYSLLNFHQDEKRIRKEFCSHSTEYQVTNHYHFREWFCGYFFDRAQQQSDPNNGEVDENDFRYPGPKPQTKEAAVLMLADAVESASRTLVDPAPARIESLVREIAERRLDDGQFDESGLTLRELRAIERSLVMSLTSIYHGRIKYPEQRTA